MILFDSFLARAAIAGAGVAIAAAPLGCFVVWRRMAYFSDATAHASILGVALALTFDAPVFAGAMVVALLMALLISTLSGRGMASDTALGVAAHSALAVGLVAVSLLPGDILAVGHGDIAIIWGGATIVLGLLSWRWSALLTATLGSDLAHASGVDPRREQLILTLALAIVVAVAIKVVGALLIGALLLIPAATARRFSATPEAMALIASGIGIGSAALGVWISWIFDTPTGPTIVCVAAAAFIVSSVAKRA